MSNDAQYAKPESAPNMLQSARVVRSGSHVELREHLASNRAAFITWYADPEIAEMLRHDLSPLSEPRARSYFDSVILPSSARGNCWAIHERATGMLIGSTAVTDIHRDRSCLFRIVIGAKAVWGKGYGTEATKLVAETVAEELEMREMRLEVFAHNERARRAYLRVGFLETGRHHEWVAAHQRQLDVIGMSLDLTHMTSRATVR